MKQRRLRWKIIPDDSGQALTEFVIVIPIVLIFFFAMLQYFSIVQATQLGNYAAYVAARVYAVNASFDSTNAPATAQKAASIVMAPIARPVPNEIGGDTAFGNEVSGVISALNGIGGTFGYDITRFGEGYVMAQYVRYNSDLLGGGVTCSLTNFASGSPTQVVVQISYPQPIYMPGLTSLWKFLGGSNIYASLSSSSAGLTGIPKYLLPIYAGNSEYLSDAEALASFDSGLSSSLQSFINGLPTVLLPYVNIQSECAIGYSDWSGIVRLPDTVGDSTGSSTNNAMQQLQQAQNDQTTYSNAVENANVACQNETNAYAQMLQAQQQADQNPTNSQAQANYQQAQQTYSNFYYSNQTAQTTVNNAAGVVNNDYQNLPSVGGNSPPTVGGVNCPSCPPP
jgi:Flp pilus assembly protein TadG